MSVSIQLEHSCCFGDKSESCCRWRVTIAPALIDLHFSKVWGTGTLTTCTFVCCQFERIGSSCSLDVPAAFHAADGLLKQPRIADKSEQDVFQKRQTFDVDWQWNFYHMDSCSIMHAFCGELLPNTETAHQFHRDMFRRGSGQIHIMQCCICLRQGWLPASYTDSISCSVHLFITFWTQVSVPLGICCVRLSVKGIENMNMPCATDRWIAWETFAPPFPFRQKAFLTGRHIALLHVPGRVWLQLYMCQRTQSNFKRRAKRLFNM